MTGFESKRQASKSLVANPWREAIDNALICTQIGTVDSFPTADQALEALIDWHVAVALDPEVSSDAQALVDRGAAQAAPESAVPVFTEGHCKEKAKKGGCQLYQNLHCGYPACDRRPTSLPAAAVAEPLKDWEFVAMWATAAEKHDDTYNVTVEFGRAVEARHGIKGRKT